MAYDSTQTSLVQQLEDAKAHLKRGWCQNTYVGSGGSVCLVQALCNAGGLSIHHDGFDQEPLVLAVAAQTPNVTPRHLSNHGRLCAFNNDVKTVDEVIAMLDKVIAVH